MQVDVSSAVILLGGWFVMNAVTELTKMLFQKMRTSDYVTKHDCERCKKNHDNDEQDVVQQIKVIKKLMVQIAIKNGIDTKSIEELVD